MICQVCSSFLANSTVDQVNITVPKMYPNSGNAAILAVLVSNRINNLRTINRDQ
jgi:hypothetical protein